MCKFNKNTNFKLIYKGTIDGFQAQDFHYKCDFVTNTLTLIETSNNRVFGGYTSRNWTGILIKKKYK
jgi:hypothetical protein